MSKHFQNLPQETIDQIAKYLPQENNPSKSNPGQGWMVCKDLNAAIMRGLCRDQPLTTFRSRSGRKFIHQNITGYLKAHVKRVRGGRKLKMHEGNQVVEAANYDLMQYIVEILNRIYALVSFDKSDHDLMDEHEAMLCEAIVFFFTFKQVGRAHWHQKDHRQKLTQLRNLVMYQPHAFKNWIPMLEARNTKGVATLAAAVVIENEYALNLLLNTHSIWDKSALFGTPFCAAITAGRDSIAIAALKRLEPRSPIDINIRATLLDAVEIALNRKFGRMAKILIRFLQANPYEYTDSRTLSRWLVPSISCRDYHLVDAIVAILSMRRTDRLLYVDAFIKACEEGQVAMINLLLSKELVAVNQPTAHYGKSPLEIAIRVTPRDVRVEAVKCLLSHGANPDGYARRLQTITGFCLVAALQPHNYSGTETSRASDYTEGMEIFRMLLNAGADPAHVRVVGIAGIIPYMENVITHTVHTSLAHPELLKPMAWMKLFSEIPDCLGQGEKLWVLEEAEMALNEQQDVVMNEDEPIDPDEDLWFLTDDDGESTLSANSTY